jgi:hypothetical protein
MRQPLKIFSAAKGSEQYDVQTSHEKLLHLKEYFHNWSEYQTIKYAIP